MNPGRLFCTFCWHGEIGANLTRITFDGPSGIEETEACPLCFAKIRKTLYETFSKTESE